MAWHLGKEKRTLVQIKIKPIIINWQSPVHMEKLLIFHIKIKYFYSSKGQIESEKISHKVRKY